MNKKKSAEVPEIVISHPQKLIYPESGFTKRGVIDYYTKIASYFIPYAKNHPVVMHRFPNGIDEPGFYQKEVPDYFPEWIKRVTIELKKGGHQTLVLINSQQDLIYLANQLVLEFHLWLSRGDQPNKPDKIVFDLDPAVEKIGEKDLINLQTTAKRIKSVLESHGLVPFLMTTGSRGYHIVTPIVPEHPFETVHDFARSIATELASKYPNTISDTVSEEQRRGKIFIDYLRNSYGQTSIAPYSLRARHGAPVATPLDWSELTSTQPKKYTIKNIFRRLARKENPWASFAQESKNLVL